MKANPGLQREQSALEPAVEEGHTTRVDAMGAGSWQRPERFCETATAAQHKSAAQCQAAPEQQGQLDEVQARAHQLGQQPEDPKCAKERLQEPGPAQRRAAVEDKCRSRDTSHGDKKRPRQDENGNVEAKRHWSATVQQQEPAAAMQASVVEVRPAWLSMEAGAEQQQQDTALLARQQRSSSCTRHRLGTMRG
jgi:hypothetical protein